MSNHFFINKSQLFIANAFRTGQNFNQSDARKDRPFRAVRYEPEEPPHLFNVTKIFFKQINKNNAVYGYRSPHEALSCLIYLSAPPKARQTSLPKPSSSLTGSTDRFVISARRSSSWVT